MQVRISTYMGALVLEESSGEPLGTLAGVLIHPDTGKVEGVFVQVNDGFSSGLLFCRALDIIRFGTSVHIRSAGALCDPSEIVRLQSLLEDGRTVLGQQVRTESGQKVGRCRDVQFDTESLLLEWIFPKRWFRWKRGIAVSDILEVRSDVIIVRDEKRPVVEEVVEEKTPVFDPLEVVEPKVSRVRE